MIALHILQLLEDNGFGTIDALENGLFYEKLPLSGTGIAIYTRGSAMNRSTRNIQAFDFYSRGKTDLLGADKLEKVMQFIQSNYVACTLPVTPKSNKQYKGVTLETQSNVESLGLDENDRIVFRLSCQANYQK